MHYTCYHDPSSVTQLERLGEWIAGQYPDLPFHILAYNASRYWGYWGEWYSVVCSSVGFAHQTWKIAPQFRIESGKC